MIQLQFTSNRAAIIFFVHFTIIAFIGGNVLKKYIRTSNAEPLLTIFQSIAETSLSFSGENPSASI